MLGAKAIEEMPLEAVSRLLDAAERDTGQDLGEVRELLQWWETEQDVWELEQMLLLTSGRKSFLEIGSRFGGTLYRVAQTLAPKSLVVSVDYPAGDLTPCPHHPKEALEEHGRKIRGLGHTCHLLNANSQDLATVEHVNKFGRFDFCFIDADHSYEGVRADWENYGPLADVVGFHDIAGLDAGCVQFWNELKRDWHHIEFINPHGKRKLGIGIIFRAL